MCGARAQRHRKAASHCEYMLWYMVAAVLPFDVWGAEEGPQKSEGLAKMMGNWMRARWINVFMSARIELASMACWFVRAADVI